MSNVKSWSKGLLALVILVGLSACSKDEKKNALLVGGGATPEKTSSDVKSGKPAKTQFDESVSSKPTPFNNVASMDASHLDGLWMGACENMLDMSMRQGLLFAQDMVWVTTVVYSDEACSVEENKYYQDSYYYSIGAKDEVTSGHFITFQSASGESKEMFHITDNTYQYELRLAPATADLQQLAEAFVYTR